jgi:uncharacterized protein DUF4232
MFRPAAASGEVYFPRGKAPAVSATNANGKQLGSAAARDTSAPSQIVNVPSGGTAHAVLRYEDVQIDSSAGCSRTAAAFLRVYPPDQANARRAFFSLPVCTVTGRVYLRIWRIQPGV